MVRRIEIIILAVLLVVSVATSNGREIGNPGKDFGKDSGHEKQGDNFDLPYPLEGHVPDSSEFEAIELPTAFTTYDLDKNGFVNLAELAEVTETKVVDAKEPFQNADTNGDGVLDESEFQRAPWSFKPEVELQLS